MKKIHILLFVFSSLLLFVFTACEKDEERMYVVPSGQETAPSLSMQGSSYVEVTGDNYDIYPVVLNWSRSYFGKDVVIEYILQIDTLESFETGMRLSLGNSIYSKALSGKDLSDWAINNFNAYDEITKEMRQLNFNMRIIATAALADNKVTNPTDSVFSNSIAFDVLAYYEAPAYPETMYMIGEEFGAWDWNSPGVVTMTPTWGFEGNFWCVRYISAGKGFKWCAQKAWNGDFYKLDEEIGYTDDGSNAYVGEDGMYIVYMDMKKGKISIEPAQVYGMGDCFGGWDVGAYPFIVSGKLMKITTSSSGELRMYANSSISPIGNEWWKQEFILLNGQIVYRGNGDDQERVSVEAGKVITLDFNAGTGTIE